jgi:hypothetical protein
MNTQTLEDIRAGFEKGQVVPYIGPGVLALAGENCPLPTGPDVLVGKLTAKATVPHKIRKNLSAAAQFIENFKHRKTISSVMTEAFAPHQDPTALHTWIASIPNLPLVVHAWYDDVMQQAVAASRTNWGTVQAVSQAERLATWVEYYNPDGSKIAKDEELAAAAAWSTVLYEPIGAVKPLSNFLVSDSDYVEVLTEIDIQTPIPEKVKEIRTGRNFLFLGCRFNSQLERIFAWQIMKRSSEKHWAVLPADVTLTKNELKFLDKYYVERIDMPLEEFLAAFAPQKEAALV